MGKAAIVNVSKARLDNEGRPETGFRWVCYQGLRIYSFYWSPNSTLQEFKDFVSRLEISIRSANTEILLTGDFNAKHTYWGSPLNDRRGEALADLIDAMGLVVCNRGNSKTFSKSSINDLTIATPHTAQRTTKWTVLDEETLSDHYYLSFEITHDPPTRESRRAPKIDLQKLKTALAQERHLPLLNYMDAERKATGLKEFIQACRRPTYTGKNPRKSVHWWSPEINALRSTANHLRRTYQRKRKRYGPAASADEESRLEKPLRPGRLQRIVDDLFPQHPIRRDSEVLPATDNDGDIPLIDRAELISAARSLKNNISPGPDCIPNEVIKMVASLNPDLLAGVYNTCLLSGVFPKTWKKARLVLIRKADKPLDTPSSYRLLCLLDCLGKLLEKILDNRLR
ncbi:hypothetical protein QTP88_019982 [Uroleucon formosanum]